MLAKSVTTTFEYVSEDLIAWLKLLYIHPNRFHSPRYVKSEYLVFWFMKPRIQPDQEWVSSQETPVRCIC